MTPEPDPEPDPPTPTTGTVNFNLASLSGVASVTAWLTTSNTSSGVWDNLVSGTSKSLSLGDNTVTGVAPGTYYVAIGTGTTKLYGSDAQCKIDSGSNGYMTPRTKGTLEGAVSQEQMVVVAGGSNTAVIKVTKSSKGVDADDSEDKLD